MQLRFYQQECVEKILSYLVEEDRALCSLATGTGKTVIAAELIRQAMELKPGISILVLINSIDLIDQTAKRYQELGIDCSVFCASLNSKRIDQVTVASIQSIYNVDYNPDLIIVDETHNISDDEDSRIHSFLSTKKSKIVGFTATHYRADGYIYGDEKFYKDICFEYGIKQAILDGYLVKPVLKHTNEQFDTSNLSVRMGEFDSREVSHLTQDKEKATKQILDALPKIADRKKIVWACSSIEHATLIHSLLSEVESARIVHSELNDRVEQINDYKNTSVRHMVFVNVLKEGYDQPEIDCIVFLRPTRSPTLMVQIIGRGLRPHRGKTNCLVLDYGQVIINCGTLDNPNVRKYGAKKSELAEDAKMKFCPECLTYLYKTQDICETCGYEFKKEQREYGKNLTERSYDGSAFTEESIYKVHNIDFSIHKAKSGNDCIRIDYFSEASKFPISEFFVVSSNFAMDRFKKRLAEMGMTGEDEKKLRLMSPHDGSKYLQEMFHSSVDYLVARKDGKYFRVISAGKRDRTTNTSLPEFEPNF